MRNRQLLFSFAAFALAAVSIIAILPANQLSERYTPRTSEMLAAEGIHGAMEWQMAIRANQETGIVDHNDILQARKAAEKLGLSSHKSVGLNWSEVGPDNIGGRTRAILIDRTDHDLVFAGGVAGGLWKSTTGGSSWVQIPSVSQNIAVSCIAQDKLGNIYVGTGESFATASGGANGSAAFIGGGMYFSSDGTNFSLLSSTLPTPNTTGSQWAFINKIACDPNSGRVYAATNAGLKYSDDQGTTWSSLAPPLQAANSTDVKIGTDGTVVASILNRCYINDKGNTSWVSHSTGLPDKLPASGVGRIEFAISPQDNNYIYASAAAPNGTLAGIYRSTDKGETWTLIGPPGSTHFQPFRSQGGFNNIISVSPVNKDKVYLGGIDMWQWEQGGNFTKKTLWYLDPSSPLYIHADHHTYVWHPTNPNILYTGSDGGVSRSLDGGNTFHTLNKKYGTIQFYSICHGPQGEVLGGTQDNGTLMVDRKGNFPTEGYKVQGGDGGAAAISHLNPDVYISTVYYGGLQTTPDYGKTKFSASDFFSKRMLGLGKPGESWPASFVTPFLLWETRNHPNSVDSLYVIVEENTPAGGTIIVRSRINRYPFEYVTSTSLNKGDTIQVIDPVQSRFYLGGRNAIWMTKQIHEFGVELEWYKIADLPVGSHGVVQTVSITEDGNTLYAGTTNGHLYQISNLNAIVDSLTADVGDAHLNLINPHCIVETKLLSGLNVGTRNITSIATDPKNNDRIVVTVGNYGNNDYVFLSNNAMSSDPTFVSKQGNLPKMPVYASIIEMNNTSHVLLGTEYGVYATNNINATSVVWAEENTGMDRVPVYKLTQQLNNLPYMEIVRVIEDEVFVDIYKGTNNFGAIYAGTHGRGAFETLKYLSVEKAEGVKVSFNPSVKVFPNPVVDHASISFNLDAPASPIVRIYDLNGRLISTQQLHRFSRGNHVAELETSALGRGMYVVQIIANNRSASAKFLVR